jgi:hypothetical protein
LQEGRIVWAEELVGERMGKKDGNGANIIEAYYICMKKA